MKRIIIICEGETEEEFISKTLYLYFIKKNIYVQPINTRGIKPWESIKHTILLKLKESTDVLVSTFYDYYGIHANHKFPKWDKASKIINKNDRLTFIEDEMRKDLPVEFHLRFLPYIQLHEFEGLLFSDIKIFHEQIPANDLIGVAELEKTFRDYPDSPEMINNSRNTAPSYRLKRIINGYDKIVYGNILFDAIGIQNVREKCPRFSNWLNQLENI